MLRLNAFQFDRHLLAGGHVRPEVDVAEGPGADLAPQAVFLAHAQLHCVYIDLVDLMRRLLAMFRGITDYSITLIPVVAFLAPMWG